mgnify:CR=1 FL=1
MPEICDYEGSDYRRRFWTEGRRYEDLAERQVLARLLPPAGDAIAELGAGFGRLADLYQGYRRVYLVDYSRTLLRQAREDHAGDPRFTYVAADIRRLPLAGAAFDAVVTVRVLHHLRDIAPALAEAATLRYDPAMRIALAQINPIIGDVPGNVAKMAAAIDQAAAGGAELVVFGELSVCGYPPRDLLLRGGFIEQNLAAIEELAGHCRSVAALGASSPG